jgi:hypothetical protein
VPSDVLVSAGISAIFLFPALWFAYGMSAGLKRGAIAACIVLTCSTLLWAAWRVRPEAKYMNLAEDVSFAAFLLGWMAAFLLGSTIRWLASKRDVQPTA